MPGKKHWLSLLLVAFATTVVALAAAADSGTESAFVSLINSTRANNGLAPLQVDGGLQGHARNHTQAMIASGGIYHSSSAELSAAAGSGWSRVGENVGSGQTPETLHSAFMNSSGHAANILGDYNYVGVGTGNSADGSLWVTVVFMKKGETAPPTTAAPTPTEAPAPPPPSDSPAPTEPPSGEAVPSAPASTTTSTTTTTVAPTTTTTMIVPPDKAVAPGQSCIEATRFAQLCHD